MVGFPFYKEEWKNYYLNGMSLQRDLRVQIHETEKVSMPVP